MWWPGVCQPLKLQAEHVQCFGLLEVVSVTNPTDFNQLLLPDSGIPTICASELERDSAPIHKGKQSNLFGFRHAHFVWF